MNLWWRAAACQGQEWVSNAHGPTEVAHARRVCRECPVLQACLQEALRVEAGSPVRYRVGVRGGLSAKQRTALDRLGQPA